MRNMPFLIAACLLYITGIYCDECPVPLWYNLNCTRYNDIVFQGHGAGASIQEASSAAWGAVFRNAGLANTHVVESELYDHMRYRYGKRLDSISALSFGTGSVKSSGSPVLKVLAYYDTPGTCSDGCYHSYILIALKKRGNAVELHYPSDAGALLRSALLPGCGQIYKGKRRAGIAFLSGTVFCAAASIFLWSYGDAFYQKAINARTSDARTVYERRYHSSLYSSIGAAALAGVVYTWNIFHARSVTGVPALKEVR